MAYPLQVSLVREVRGNLCELVEGWREFQKELLADGSLPDTTALSRGDQQVAILLRFS